MATTEQKIEQLLKDLDNYAKDVDYYGAGLPLLNTYGMAHMKSIVQSFVDSLKEDDKLSHWDENQKNAYGAFLSVGIPDNWAKVMSDRVVDDGWKYANPTAPSMLKNFATWSGTPEGADFWYDLVCAVELEDVSAFSKFKCPQ